MLRITARPREERERCFRGTSSQCRHSVPVESAQRQKNRAAADCFDDVVGDERRSMGAAFRAKNGGARGAGGGAEKRSVSSLPCVGVDSGMKHEGR